MGEQALVIRNESTYTQLETLEERVIQRLKLFSMNKAALALQINVSRTKLSRYLSGKYEGNTAEMEVKLRLFLEETEDEALQRLGIAPDTAAAQGISVVKSANGNQTLHRVENYESYDFQSIIGICHSCQQEAALGLVVGKSGFGKTHALKYYTKMKRVAYVECDDTMATKDLVEDIEKAIGIPTTYGTIHKRLNGIREFFKVNKGYLLIIDEADKLISKYTQKKMEVIRAIFDQADVGMIIAGEPRLESEIKGYLNRCANRIDLYWKLTGLTEKEVRDYLSGFDIDEDAMKELMVRACNNKTGCFRLFDRTLKNVIRIMQESNDTHITYEIIRKASSMMML